MRKTLLTLLVATMVIWIVSSCKKTVKAIFPGAETDLPELRYTLPPVNNPIIPLNTTFPLPRVEQPFNLDSIVRANTGNNFGAGDISSVKIKQLTLKIIAGADSANNLSNFNSANFNFSSNSKTTATQVATINFLNVYSTSKTIPGDGTPELRAYLDGNKLYYDINASIRRYTNASLKLSIVATMIMK